MPTKKAKKNIKPETLEEYKRYVRKRLAELTPIIQKAAVGDFSKIIKIDQEEHEFTELFVGLNLMIDDLKELDEARRATEKEEQKRLGELEKWKMLTTGRELKMVGLKKKIIQLEEKISRLQETVRGSL